MGLWQIAVAIAGMGAKAFQRDVKKYGLKRAVERGMFGPQLDALKHGPKVVKLAAKRVKPGKGHHVATLTHEILLRAHPMLDELFHGDQPGYITVEDARNLIHALLTVVQKQGAALQKVGEGFEVKLLEEAPSEKKGGGLALALPAAGALWYMLGSRR